MPNQYLYKKFTDIKTFADIMREFPAEKLWDLLMNPKDIDDRLFLYVIGWCCPKLTNARTFFELSQVESFHPFDRTIAPPSKSELQRLVRSGALKWNGILVKDIFMPIDWLNPGWGVIQIGKKTHKVIRRM
jgi:hypothetical protein